MNFDTSYFGSETGLKSQIVCGLISEVVKAFYKVNGNGNKGHILGERLMSSAEVKSLVR